MEKMAVWSLTLSLCNLQWLSYYSRVRGRKWFSWRGVYPSGTLLHRRSSSAAEPRIQRVKPKWVDPRVERGAAGSDLRLCGNAHGKFWNDSAADDSLHTPICAGS